MQKSNIFGDHFVYSKKETQQKVICIEKSFGEKRSLEKEIEEIKKQILLKNDYILSILDYSIEIQKSWCATQFVLRVFIEYPEKNLKQLIMEKKDYWLKNEN